MGDYFAFDRAGAPPEADRFADHPHPREMLWYGGSIEGERALLDAYRLDKLHHAWMLTGPEGIGKATLAYRFARFVLAHPDPGAPEARHAVDLSVAMEHLVAGQVARMSHPDLAAIRRGLTKDGKSLRAEIAVDDVRDGLSIFRVTAGAGGWRFVIVDAADDLNRASANALLKMLEEPPERAVFILVTHRPGALLPTIRSRCRVLRVPALDESAVREGLSRLTDAAPDVAAEAAAASGGNLRAALGELDPGIHALRSEARRLLADVARGGGRAAMALADKTLGKSGAESMKVIVDALESHLREGIRTSIGGAEAPRLLAARAELWEKIRRSARDVEDYNLDRRPFLLAAFSDLAEIERRARA